MDVAGRVLAVALVALLVLAVARAAQPRSRAEDEVAFRRRRAEWTTVAAGVVLGYLVAVCVVAAPIGGPPDPLGMVAFVALAVTAAFALPVLRSVWRTARRVRRDADAATSPGPDLAPPRPHRGLSGEDLPPSRW